jgi:hypothetical protein
MSFSTGERIPLTGADCFLRAFDYEARRYHGASHLAQLVVRLGPGFDPARFESQLARIVRRHPVLRAMIRRPFVIGAPAYCIPSQAAAVPIRTAHQESVTAGSERPVPAVFFERLNDRFAIELGDLLRFDIVRYDDGSTDVAMTWAHMLFDAAGSETFLAALARGVEEPLPPWQDTPGDRGSSPPWRRFVHGAQVARRWGERMAALGSPPTRSLAGPLRTVPQRLRYALTGFSASETESVVARSARYAGFLTPAMFYLAAAMRAHAAVFASRSTEPECYLVPLPVRVPAADASVPVGTHVSLLWFRVLREHTRDFAGLVEELRRQRLEQIRSQAVDETAVALDFVRPLPLRTYAYMLRRNLQGELASFVFAFTGELAPGLERLAGAEIVNAFHAPAVQPSPGSGLILCMWRGALNLVHVYQEGVLSDAERTLLREHLVEDLLRT